MKHEIQWVVTAVIADFDPQKFGHPPDTTVDDLGYALAETYHSAEVTWLTSDLDVGVKDDVPVTYLTARAGSFLGAQSVLDGLGGQPIETYGPIPEVVYDEEDAAAVTMREELDCTNPHHPHSPHIHNEEEEEEETP